MHPLFGRNDHQHLTAFHARIGFHLGDFGGIFLYALEQHHAELTVRKLASAEPQRDFHLITFTDEFVDRLHLRLIIMIVDVGAHLDFFDFLRLLSLAREVRLLLRLIFECADVEEFGNRWIGVG